MTRRLLAMLLCCAATLDAQPNGGERARDQPVFLTDFVARRLTVVALESYRQRCLLFTQGGAV